MEQPDEYALSGHGRMLRDDARVSAYLEALRAVVTPHSVVLDIGTGVGFFAVAAAKLGARRVIGVEHDASIYIARGIVEDNDVTDIVTLVRGSSLDLVLDEPADVVISDLRGVLPFYRQHLQVIIDAKRRLASPNAVLIPLRDELLVALVTSAEAYSLFERPWGQFEKGLDLRFARQFAVNSWSAVSGAPEMLLGAPQPWGTLDYQTLTREDLSGTVLLTVERPGTAHGLLVWFDAVLAPGVGYSNAPGGSGCIYGQAFLPLEREMPVRPGDRVRLEIGAKPHGGDYTWTWTTTFLQHDGITGETFQQSTVRGWVTRPS